MRHVHGINLILEARRLELSTFLPIAGEKCSSAVLSLSMSYSSTVFWSSFFINFPTVRILPFMTSSSLDAFSQVNRIILCSDSDWAVSLSWIVLATNSKFMGRAVAPRFKWVSISNMNLDKTSDDAYRRRPIIGINHLVGPDLLGIREYYRYSPGDLLNCLLTHN